MPMDRFLIAPINTGLQTDLRPWLIPDDAFAMLNNAYVFRGRVRKRFGSKYMGTLSPVPLSSRFSVLIGTTDPLTGNISGTVPGVTTAGRIGQAFSINSVVFTVYQTGNPAKMLRSDGLSATATFDTTTGAFVIDSGPLDADLYFYPALPVMGLTLYELGPVDNQPSYGFDTQFAYIFASGYWQQSTAGTSPQWHGTDLNFFWTCNWEGVIPGQVALMVSNYYVVNPNGGGNANDDPIWWFIQGIGWTPGTGTNAFYFAPNDGDPQTGPFVKTALIIVPFQGRLVLLNTIENDNGGGLGTNTQYVNRCRFSAVGSPFAQNAWYEPNQQDNAATAGGLSLFAGGGFVDATTEEQIVSAEFIKDRLIVYFERSTWELAYTGNQILPFVWQKINTELGSESTFSTVPFDKLILTIGNTGVHGCSGANVERIDNKIPDQIFQINNQNGGIARVAGIRDYLVEMVYWAFPSIDENADDIYPNRVLVYNYRDNSWAFNDDCITAFGYFEQQSGITWELATYPWETANWSWNSGVLEAQSRQVIAGNQQGFVFLIQPDNSANAAVMQLTNITVGTNNLNLTIINHTLQLNDFIQIQGTGSGFSFVDAYGNTRTIFKIIAVVDSNTVTIGPIFLVGTYNGGGYVARVSQIDILSKQWNPYVEKGRNFYLAKIDFGVLKTTSGQVTVDYYPSYTEYSMLTEAEPGVIMGNGVLQTSPYVLYPLEFEQSLLWHPVYFQTEGEAIQINISLNDFQMITPSIVFSDFELQGMILHTQPTATRLQ